MATGLVATVLTVVTGGTEPGAKGEIKTKSILADRTPKWPPILPNAASLSNWIR
ncbi:MAG: hypothetical protein ACK446_10920 [Rhodobacterales bacterium]|jgi:hypothetical protein